MSLPTRARFYNASGELIAQHFVNVGWWLTEEIFADTVLSLPEVIHAEYCELYGIIIPKDLLPKQNKIDWKEQRDKIEEFAIHGVKFFNQENQNLRQALIQLYITENK